MEDGRWKMDRRNTARARVLLIGFSCGLRADPHVVNTHVTACIMLSCAKPGCVNAQLGTVSDIITFSCAKP